jgi:hypothetical protein
MPGERLSGDEFYFSKVTVDSITPIEEAPQGALQLDFANRNIGGGALDKVNIMKSGFCHLLTFGFIVY